MPREFVSIRKYKSYDHLDLLQTRKVTDFFQNIFSCSFIWMEDKIVKFESQIKFLISSFFVIDMQIQ